MAKKFVPDGGFAWAALVQTLLVGALTAAMVGYALGWVGAKWVHLVILWPLVMGGASGAVVAFPVKRTFIRHRLLAFASGAVCAAVAYAASHHVAYLLARMEFREDAVSQGIPSEDGLLTPAPEEADEIFDSLLRQRTGSGGAWGFVKFEAQEGVTISHRGRHGAHVGETGTWIVYAFELLAAVAIGGVMAREPAGRPFCTSCRAWYEEGHAIPFAGSSGKEIARLVEANHVTRLAAAAQQAPPGQPLAVVELLDCPHCAMADTVAEVQWVTFEKKEGTPKKKRLGRYVLPRSEAADLLTLARQQLEAAAAANPTGEPV